MSMPINHIKCKYYLFCFSHKLISFILLSGNLKKQNLVPIVVKKKKQKKKNKKKKKRFLRGLENSGFSLQSGFSHDVAQMFL